MLRKIFQFDAPSTRAASIRSRGSVMKKLRSRKMQNGSANTVWAIQIPKYHPVIAVFVPVRNSPRSWNSIRIGTNALCTGTTISATSERKIVSRSGKRIHENAYAAIEPMKSGRSVDGHRDQRAVEEARAHLVRVQHEVVVLEREVHARERRPPARRGDVRAWPERRHEQPDRSGASQSAGEHDEPDVDRACARGTPTMRVEADWRGRTAIVSAAVVKRSPPRCGNAGSARSSRG